MKNMLAVVGECLRSHGADYLAPRPEYLEVVRMDELLLLQEQDVTKREWPTQKSVPEVP